MFGIFLPPQKKKTQTTTKEAKKRHCYAIISEYPAKQSCRLSVQVVVSRAEKSWGKLCKPGQDLERGGNSLCHEVSLAVPFNKL